MNVQEAQERAKRSASNCREPLTCAIVQIEFDLLILEVQAEIKCEWVGGDQIFDCTGEFDGVVYPEFSRGGELCKTCTARMKLKELLVKA